MTDTAKRKLSAILHADAVGYSALMSSAEEATHADLRRSITAAREIVQAHGGRVTGTAGDAFLADFSSVLDALNAAVEFQEAMKVANAEAPPDRQLAFRIGLNLGEVIDDGGDIFGSGVNIAARIQSLADPGGIAISGAVYDIVQYRVSYEFWDRGEHRVKNIPEPVRVYAIGSDGARLPVPSNNRWWIAAAAALAVSLIVAFAWTIERINIAPTSNQMAEPGSGSISEERPMVAILPFNVLGEDEDQEFFGEGMTEDTISQLGRFSGVLVLSWSAVAHYRSKDVSLDELTRKLNVRYVLTGSVRRSNALVRISVQLTDAAKGTLLWSQVYDEPATNLFEVQDKISREVVRALAIELTSIEQERVFEKPTDSLTAYEMVLRGRHLLRSSEFDDNLDARALFQRAIELDPDYGDAYVGLGWTFNSDVYWGWDEDAQRAINNSEAQARKALVLDANNSGARALLAEALWLKGEVEQSQVEIKRALSLNPNDANSQAIHGKLLLFNGDWKSAIQPLEMAIRLDPNSRSSVVSNLAAAYYLEKKYEKVLQHFSSISRDFPEDPAPHAIRAAALAQLGRIDEAETATKLVRKIYPFFDSSDFAKNFYSEEAAKHIVEGLSKAGL